MLWCNFSCCPSNTHSPSIAAVSSFHSFSPSHAARSFYYQSIKKNKYILLLCEVRWKLFAVTRSSDRSDWITFVKSNQEFMVEKEAKWEQIKWFKAIGSTATTQLQMLEIFYDYDYSSCRELFDPPNRLGSLSTRFALGV